MRLIGQVADEKSGFIFVSFLERQGIAASYEKGGEGVQIWVENEDDFSTASQFLEQFKKDPKEFSLPPLKEERISPIASRQAVGKTRLRIVAHHSTFSMTNLLIVLCVFLFIWSNLQERLLVNQTGSIAEQIGLVPLEQTLMFDYALPMQARQDFLQTHPLKEYKSLAELPPEYQKQLQNIEEMPTWRGVYELLINRIDGVPISLQNITLFHDIRQGEIWRLLTPAFLHFNFLHILFNMAWLWMLGRQIESRLGRLRLFILTVIIAVVANVAQYLMTGPLFLGYSGVVVGMAGFIWIRQKVAPWEGYPLPKTTALFLGFFVLAIFALQLVASILQIAKIVDVAPNIANTAHIVGGIAGMLLAKIPLFFRKTN